MSQQQYLWYTDCNKMDCMGNSPFLNRYQKVYKTPIYKSREEILQDPNFSKVIIGCENDFLCKAWQFTYNDGDTTGELRTTTRLPLNCSDRVPSKQHVIGLLKINERPLPRPENMTDMSYPKNRYLLLFILIIVVGVVLLLVKKCSAKSNITTGSYM